MSESPYAEIEVVLLLVVEACERAGNAARGLAADGAEPHLVEALREAERELVGLHRRLMDRAYFAAPVRPHEQLRL
jgi:hypothetical protein